MFSLRNKKEILVENSTLSSDGIMHYNEPIQFQVTGLSNTNRLEKN